MCVFVLFFSVLLLISFMRQKYKLDALSEIAVLDRKLCVDGFICNIAFGQKTLLYREFVRGLEYMISPRKTSKGTVLNNPNVS